MESTQKTNPLNTINDDECINGIYNVDIIIEKFQEKDGIELYVYCYALTKKKYTGISL